jgi:hypothetical protein
MNNIYKYNSNKTIGTMKNIWELLNCTTIITRDHPVVIVAPYHRPDCLIMSLHIKELHKNHQSRFFPGQKSKLKDHNYTPEESFQN